MPIVDTEKLDSLVFGNEETFIKKFIKGDVMDLYNIFYGTHNVCIYYCLESGQHISDCITWGDFNYFLQEVGN